MQGLITTKFTGHKYNDTNCNIKTLLNPDYNSQDDEFKRIITYEEAGSINPMRDRELINEMKFQTKNMTRRIRRIYEPPAYPPAIFCLFIYTNDANSVFTEGGQERRYQHMKCADGYNLQNHPDAKYRRKIEQLVSGNNQFWYDCIMTVYRHFNSEAHKTDPEKIIKYSWQLDAEDEHIPKWIDYILAYCDDEKIRWDEEDAEMCCDDFLVWLSWRARTDCQKATENNRKPFYKELKWAIKETNMTGMYREERRDKRKWFLLLKPYFDRYFSRKITNRLPKWWE